MGRRSGLPPPGQRRRGDRVQRPPPPGGFPLSLRHHVLTLSLRVPRKVLSCILFGGILWVSANNPNRHAALTEKIYGVQSLATD